MKRVNKENLCPVCGKHNWCLYAKDGSAAICQRIEEGSVKRCGDSGYLHILTDRPKNQQHRSQRKFTVSQDDNKPEKDFTALQQQYSLQINDKQVNGISRQLGVSMQSLKRLCIGWDGRAYTFPMSNDFSKIIGIRRRFPNGRKVSLTGSRTGMFIPSDLSPEGCLLICEGPTDTAAALDLGFDAIGRPNCNSKVTLTVAFCKGRSEVIIICDNDDAGKTGAKKLAEKLLLHCSYVKIIYPPAGIKDLRQCLQVGLTSSQLQQIIENTKPLKRELRYGISDCLPKN